MKFHLPDLPYSSDAFDGFLSPQSFHYHYHKHHQKYVDQTNLLIRSSPEYSGLSLEEIIRGAEGKLFNNAAQAWNHTFFWNSLSPRGSEPSRDLESAIRRSFPKGGIEELRSEFLKVGKEVFGSGWVWLVADTDGKLGIIGTPNAENPIRKEKRPLLCADVWEHAYYIDHRNERGTYLEQLFARLNWKFANENFDSPEVANMTAKMVAQN